ncbi:hypothetical protein FOZ63_016170, partial [Perkinsus olseni]
EVKNMIRRQNALAAADAKRAGLRREHSSVSNDAAHFLKRMGGIRLDSSGQRLAMDNDTRRLVERRNRELRDRRGCAISEDSVFGDSAKFRETQLRYTYSRIPTYLTDSEASLRVLLRAFRVR